jgi:hypothetical protein
MSGSRPLKGSSSSIISGSAARARAIPTRCCIPPLRDDGRLNGLHGHFLSFLFRDPSDLEAIGGVVEHGVVRKEAKGLEDHGSGLAAKFHEFLFT